MIVVDDATTKDIEFRVVKKPQTGAAPERVSPASDL